MSMSRNSIFVFLVSLLVFGVAEVCNAKQPHPKLKMNFYVTKCPEAEVLVRNITWSKLKTNPALGAKLLRMHFHDCFVRGCDASVLLDAVDNTQAEKDARPNLTLQGFVEIDEIKTEVEKLCPGVVSCADILSLAARDSVSFLPFLDHDSDSIPPFKPMWPVLTGRRDGNTSLASETNGNVPSPFSNFSTLMNVFDSKGLDVNDLAALSGGHSIGVAHCGTFSARLYNFNGTGEADSSLNAAYVEILKAQCPNPANPVTTVEMDPQSSVSFDSNYFKILLQKKGLFQSDAALLTNLRAAIRVATLQNSKLFYIKFAESMLKMGNIGVLTGDDGEIRKQCRVVNSK
ncbi:hypothetical protein Pint_25005 [Pistacia integerrima]|uniref:Uncharacterized protein n=1 Tax=Pistacia integerrima TaxID=434235 RepID=A0ACC0YCP2_9ROSI|nr:hypothetical protein Pint_25005 [Pistacia integerrima]